MHRVFGIKENVKYLDRGGVYIIPCHNKQVGVVMFCRGIYQTSYDWILSSDPNILLREIT